jgi:uncharacterized protein (DUF433 family)
MTKLVVHVDPEILGGTPVFVGTRVPPQALFDYLEYGHSLDEFLDDFPSVPRELAIAALEEANDALIHRARSA